MTEYVLNFLPADIFRAHYPFLLYGLVRFWRDRRSKKQSADIVYLCTFYVLFFSLIGHKEQRFLLPILPFLFLILGFELSKSI